MAAHVVYVGWAGDQAALVAAALHLGWLPWHRPPDRAELAALDERAAGAVAAHGWLRYLGSDACGRRVYVLGAAGAAPVVARALCGLAEAAGLGPAALCVVDASRAGGPALRVGRWLARWGPLRGLGEAMARAGLRRAFPALRRLAERGRAATAGGGSAARADGAGERAPRVVYYCYGGVHTSVVAAAIHLGRLPRDRVPDASAILALPAFDRRRPPPLGQPHWFGRDAAGAWVGALGLGPCRRRAARAVRAALRELGVDAARLVLVPVLEHTGWPVRLGGFLAQRLGWHGLGARLVAAGMRRAYPRLVAAVRGAEARARRRAWAAAAGHGDGAGHGGG